MLDNPFAQDNMLTIEEVAKYLRVSERTIYDWAQKGKIPAGKLGTVWRFKKSEIEKWINDRLAGYSSPAQEQRQVRIQSVLSPSRVVFIEHSARQDALVELSKVLGSAPQVKNQSELTAEILRREELMSTAIGLGIAIPHVRLSSVTDLVMAVGICRNEIADFQSIDNEPVRLLFMLAAAHNQHAYYLQTLAVISAKLKNQELREGLINASSAQEAYALIIENENAGIATG